MAKIFHGPPARCFVKAYQNCHRLPDTACWAAPAIKLLRCQAAFNTKASEQRPLHEDATRIGRMVTGMSDARNAAVAVLRRNAHHTLDGAKATAIVGQELTLATLDLFFPTRRKKLKQRSRKNWQASAVAPTDLCSTAALCNDPP